MIKIWAKIVKNNKIIKSTVLEKPENMDYSEFFTYLSEICSALDVATPVLVKPHIFNYAKFNHVKFTKSDFLEPTDFDKLVLENILR